MAFATIDVTKGITGVTPVANGGTALSSGFVNGGGITEADQWRITSDLAVGSSTVITANWERNDSNFDKLGTGMSESSGIFTFPGTGIWQITANASWRANGSDETYLGIIIQLSTNSGGAYVDNSRNFTFLNNGLSGAAEHSAAITQTMIDVTDVSTFRLKFEAQASDGFCSLLGNSGTSESTFTFLKLGET
tara:strand:- start:42 stop:617 length:576 start_codon:yes stop_codon:yes gene_type:complete